MLGIEETSIGRLKKELTEQPQEQKEKLEETVDRPRTRTQSAAVSSQSYRKAALVICCAHEYHFDYSISGTVAQNRKFRSSAVGAHRNG